MGYCTINKSLIYISREIDKEIISAWEKIGNKTASEKIGRIIANSKGSKDFNLFSFNYLNNIDKKTLTSRYLNFNFDENELKFEISDLLYDHCHYYGGSIIKDTRDFTEKIIDDYNYDSRIFPFGKEIIFEQKIKRGISTLFITEDNQRKIKIFINLGKVKRIEGNLECFNVYYEGMIISFGKDVSISPY